MGGRGAWAERRRGGNLPPPRNVTLNSGAGGGAVAEVEMTSAAGGGADLSSFTVESASFSMSGGQGGDGRWKEASASNGQIVIRDANGKEFRSIQSSSGSTRVTYEFAEGFALKFEGIVKRTYGNQNAVDMESYRAVKASDQKYIARPLSENRQMTLKINGRSKRVDVIPVQRAIPTKRAIPEAEHRRLEKLYFDVKNRNSIADVGFPSLGSAKGHNVYIVDAPNGGFTVKFIDIGLARAMRR